MVNRWLQQMQEQVKEFAQAKIDSAKTAAKDTLNAIKKQLGDAAKEELSKKLFGTKDTIALADSTSTPKNPTQKTKESVKGLLNTLMKKKPKDSTQQK